MQPALRRELGVMDLALFNVAAVVGIRWVAAAAHTGPGSMTLWVLAALLFFIPCAFAVAGLARKMPEEGGIYIWTQNAFGGWHAFFCGYTYWVSNLFFFPNLVLAGVGMAATALGIAETKAMMIAVSLGVMWLAILMNVRGVGVGKWMGNIGGLATYAAGVVLILTGAIVFARWGSVTPFHFTPEWNFEKLNFWSQIAMAFGGLELGAIMAGEIANPERTIPRAAWISGIGIAGFYMLGTLAVLVVLLPDQVNVITGLVQAGAVAGTRLGVPWLAPLLATLLCFSVTGQLSAWVAGNARIPYVMGMDRYIPQAFGALHPRWGTPHISILTQGVMATIFLLILQLGEDLKVGYQLLVDMTIICYFIPFAYLFASAWRFGQPLAAVCGGTVTVLVLILSLVPPAGTASVWLFELKLIGGTALLAGLARWWFQRHRPA